jgi:AraC-like DNA-binding protein
VARTGCNHFGLLVGQQGGLSSLGLVGYLVQHSPDVGSALRGLVRYFHLHAQGAAVDLAEEADLAFLSSGIYQLRVEAIDQIEDGAVATAFNILCNLCGRDWKPIEVRFSHRKPKDIGPFRQFFRAPLRFDAEQNGVLFPAECLKHPVDNADPELRRLLQKQVDVLEASHNEDFPDQVRRVLRTALLTGHAKADQVAALFSMHTRTLNRRLKTAGTSFQEIADQGRYEIAQQMLESSELELVQIALALDYADASAFTRAFRRWSGTTPSVWRAKRTTGRLHGRGLAPHAGL